MLPTATSGWLAKVVPDTGFSYEKSPKNITSNPPNGRSVPSARRFQLSRFQVTLPIRMSRTPTSCAEIILTSSMRTQRKLCANLCASLVRAVPSVSPIGMPDQWCKVQPPIWEAIGFWKARQTHCTARHGSSLRCWLLPSKSTYSCLEASIPQPPPHRPHWPQRNSRSGNNLR